MDDTDVPQRTVGKLRKNADKARQIRLEKQINEHKKQEIQRRKQREAYLKSLSNNFPMAWALVRESVERGSGRGYGQACQTLIDVSEAYTLFATRKQFRQELKKFMAGHLRRKALIQRLVKAGIWQEQ